MRASPAEAIDAARAVQAVGVEQREGFRLALKTTLAKTRDDASAFDRVFDAFFAAPAASREKGRAGGGGPPDGGGASRGRPTPPDAEPRAGQGARRAREENPERRTRPGRLKILLAPRQGAAIAAGRRRPDRQPGAAAVPVGPRRPGAPRPRPLPPSRRETAAGRPDPRHIDLSLRLTRDDEERIAREVPRLIREIRLRAGRRHRPGRAGRLWAARLMRANVGTEGVPFVLPYRRRRPRRARVVVLADVSWSVMRASSIFLLMAREFLSGGARASIHLFVDRCVEATGPLRRWPGPERVSFERLLESLPLLDPKAPSDYGRAFYQAIGSRGGALKGTGRDTLLVVLGDARNNFRDPQSWAFEELAARCRRVIWLNPEPAARWSTGDSALHAYLPHCDVVCEAGDLDGLARGVAEIARSL